MEPIKREAAYMKNGVTTELLKGCMDEHARRLPELQRLYDRYMGKYDILDRKSIVEYAPNNRVVCNFAKYITDVNTGYMFGNPISYQLENYDISELMEAFEYADANTRDAELGKLLSVFGIAYELAYISSEVNPRMKLAPLDPRNAFVVYDDTVEQTPLFGCSISVRRKIDGSLGGSTATVYTRDMTRVYERVQYGNDLRLLSESPHYFGEVPIVQYWNNEEGQSDYASVLSLIDAYNTLTSDRVNDKERFVSAILAVSGGTFGEPNADGTMPDVIGMLRRGIMILPLDAKAEYLTKALNEADTQTLAKELAARIHMFSQTPDFTDENFAGNASGVAMRYKLLSLEYSCRTKECYFTEGLRKRLRLFANILAVKGAAAIDTDAVSILYDRSLPVNEFETAQAMSAYKSAGLVSTETLLTQVSFVKDVAAEMENIVKEKNAAADGFEEGEAEG
jgi:SPP1 family phage portal protein